MRVQTVLTLICFLAVSSALNATLEQSLFFVSPGNWLSYEMYSTARGIIARSSEYTNNVQHDVYSLIDLKTNQITTILTDIVTSCGNSALDFDKLHYHVPTSTLVYYCLANNSLLIIDEQEFTVQGSITTLISATFDQVKIVTDDYSVAILGMTGLLSQSPSPTQLIEINLQSHEIVNNITFDKGLRTGEAVTGYASNGKNSYVLTNTVGKEGATITNNITVYSMYLIGNAYTLTPLASVNNTFSPIFSVLYCVGDLIVTNSNQTLVVISDQGTILGSFPDIMKKTFLPNNIAIVADNKSPDFYTLCENYTLYKFSYKNRGFTYEVFNHAIDMQIALGSNHANTLLIDTDTNYNFTITDLTNSQTVYNTEIMYQNMILTDTTYGIINSDFNPWKLSLFPRKPSSLPTVVPVQSDYYYDQKNEIISYLNATDDNVCQLVQVDLKTGDASVPMTFNATDYDICPGVLIHVENNQHGPQAVLYCGYSYLIVSQTFGQVNFTAPGMLTFPETLVADYDTLSVYRFLSNPPKESTDVFLYNYDSNTKSFKLNTTKNISDLATQDFYIEPGQVFAMGGTRFGVIDVPTLDRTIVDINSPWDTVSSFQDKSDKVYSILTSFAKYGTTPAVYYDNKLDNLTGVSGYTIHAGAAGECRYWISDNVGSFVEISFYNICVTEMIEDILA